MTVFEALVSGLADSLRTARPSSAHLRRSQAYDRRTTDPMHAQNGSNGEPGDEDELMPDPICQGCGGDATHHLCTDCVVPNPAVLASGLAVYLGGDPEDWDDLAERLVDYVAP